MLLKIYYIGIIISIFWWGLLSILTFEKKIYHKLSDDLKKSIDELNYSLSEFKFLSPEATFIMVSFFVTLFWFVFLTWLIWSNIRKLF